ncbi:hypothetical protein KBD08_02250 [Candidatus Babeliales bacterium]|nr:hypothetical protein [Candidatus Babeliales bacterium]
MQQLLRGEMVKDPRIDLGFQLNEYWQEKINIKDSLKYHFESNSHKQIRPYYNSWLYNNEHGDIVFEITPFYPWCGRTKKSNPEKIPYKIWIQDYKSVLKVIIPKENVATWIDQAAALKKTLI